MNFKKLKSQSGRSMVEMLGVLAIIGVLSVGGIAGYSLSMRRHRANQIADLVAKLSVIAYTECNQYVLNETDPVINDVTKCGGGQMTSYFQDRDGSTPAGPIPSVVDWIIFYKIMKNEDGTETVKLSLQITDQKLCQTVASIFGSSCEGNSIDIGIKQN